VATLALRAVRKSFGDTAVVHGIDLDVADGEFVVLIGPSGCGKSTILRMVAGLEDVTSGQILIDAAVVNEREPGQRDVAMVFQDYALYPHMSVADNMGFSLRYRGVRRDEIRRRVAEASSVLDIAHLLERRPRELSGGQRQRVAMGRAIVRDPKLFLFDEPLSNLDAKLRGQMRVEIKRLQQSLATTAIYVTHDQVEAMTLADRLVVMNAGNAEQIGTPLELYERPATMFVAGFIGSPAMNFLPATTAENSVVLADGTRLPLPAGAAPGRAVTLGVRPEHLTPDGAAGAFAVKVELAELLGADTIVHGRLGDGTLLLARLPGSAHASLGDTLRLAADPASLHLFDRETGKRL